MIRMQTRSKFQVAAALMAALMVMEAEAKPAQKVEKPPEYDAAILIAPLNDMVNMSAGTMEAHFSLDYSYDDYLRVQSSGCTPFTFLIATGPNRLLGHPKKGENEPALSIYEGQLRGHHALHYNSNLYYYEYPNRTDSNEPPIKAYAESVGSNKEKGPWFKQGEWHRFAVTWALSNDVLKIEMYVDGELKRARNFPKKTSSIEPFAKTDFIKLGGETLSPLTMLSYRLSNRVRTKEEIASDKPLVEDQNTTFLLNGTTADKIKVMKLEEWTAMRSAKKLKITQPVFFGKIKIVTSAKGKAVQFYQTRSR